MMKTRGRHTIMWTVVGALCVSILISLGVATHCGWFAGSGLVSVDDDGVPLKEGASYATMGSNQEYIVTKNGTYIYQSDNGASLDEVVGALRNSEYETVCGFDYVGNKILDCTSYKKRTVYTTSQMRADFSNLGGVLMAHNHPSGNAFSGQDLYVEATYGTPCAMVISDNYIYTLMPGAWGWDDPEELLEYWQASYGYHLNYALSYTRNYYVDHREIIRSPDVPNDDTMAWVCNRAIKDAAANGDTGPIKVPVGGWVSHMTMLDVAAHFQMDYRRYPTNEFNEARLGLFLPSTVSTADEVVILG